MNWPIRLVFLFCAVIVFLYPLGEGAAYWLHNWPAALFLVGMGCLLMALQLQEEER